MSSKAVGWALEQRVSNPTAKLIFISLADHHNKSSGECYPSVRTLAHEAECDARTVRRHLNLLEENGLITRIKRYNGGNGRQTSNVYRLVGFPGDAFPLTECHGVSDCHGPDDTGVTVVTTKPESEPKRESARAGNQQFAAFRKRWPTSAGDSKTRTRAAFEALSHDARVAAIEAVPRYLDHLVKLKRRHIPAGFTYLIDRLWEDLPKPDAGDAAKPESVHAPCFSRLWWGRYWLAVKTGNRRRAAMMRDFARAGTSTVFTRGEHDDDAAITFGETRMTGVPNGSDGHTVWADWAELKGAAMPNVPSSVEWVFVPDRETQQAWCNVSTSAAEPEYAA